MAPALIQAVEDEATSKNIELTPVEATLRELLLDVAEYIDGLPADESGEGQVALPEELAKQKLCLRFTGGWVRDKLLGVPSVDIDVAINKMTGYQFGLKMKEYLELPGNLEKYGLEDIAQNEKQNAKAGNTNKSKTVGGLHKIEANPEKSKHLETTTVRILGLDVDLVNLRKETYSDDSRNPQMEFGTAEEDALRRDATVNAMFYNINTQTVEDFTGRGHEDMRNKILRTPLEPYQTFKDDPLRVLRLIRFASRLGYEIESEAKSAMANADIKEALRRKISRERVGTELEKSLRGPDPHEALRLIFELGLYDTIFSDPTVESAEHYNPDTSHWQLVIDAVEEMQANGDVIAEHLMRDKEESFIAWQLAAMVPYRDAPQPEGEPGRKPPPAVAVVVVREGIKATNKITDLLTASLRHQNEISSFADRIYQQARRPERQFDGEDLTARDVLGMAIRRWGPTWRSQVMYSLLVEIANDEQSETAEKKYTAFLKHIEKSDLLEVCSLKPLLDGKALAKALSTPPGPWMKDALDVVMAWQLRHPGVTDPAQAIAEVQLHRQQNGELASSLVRHFLQLTIRPLFRKAQPASVTDQGRKVATPALPKRITLQSTDDSELRPWKHGKDAFALDLLRWLVARLDEKLAAEVWPLIIPPILTLVDDWETRYKRVGITLLQGLLRVTKPDLLKRTGLGEVFEEALLPCLTYLPTLTPQDESVELLSLTYPTLLLLADVRYPPNADPVSSPSSPDSPPRTKLLDTLLRKGILYGYQHAAEYPTITTALFTHLASILDHLGIDAVKHLPHILPMLAESLSHPFGTASIPMLRATNAALQALLRNCWPRVVHHRLPILQALAVCWQNVEGEQKTENEKSGGELEALRGELQETVELLAVILAEEETCDFGAETQMLVQADERLRGLFAKVPV